MSTSNQTFKADAGKLRASLLFEGCPRSLLMASAVLSYGAQKYEAHSWKGVDTERYQDAKYRHLLDMCLDGDVFSFDIESGLLHDAHELVNTMFILEQKLEGLDEEYFRELLKFNPPPTAHKASSEASKEGNSA